MEKPLDTFVGKWEVSESFEIGATRQGKTRQGIASFRSGPGFSLIEDYKSNGAAGKLHSLALFWWDESTRVYRLLTCANNDGSALRGPLKWERNTLVNSWQEEVNGQTATFKDSFVDISHQLFGWSRKARREAKRSGVWSQNTRGSMQRSNELR